MKEGNMDNGMAKSRGNTNLPASTTSPDELEAKIEKLVSLCKGSVTITFNDHTTNYNTVEKELVQNFNGLYDDVEEDVKNEMIKRNSMVDVHFYPDTPIGFHNVTHYDLNTALGESIRIIESERQL